jgi:hypothetical protein
MGETNKGGIKMTNKFVIAAALGVLFGAQGLRAAEAQIVEEVTLAIPQISEIKDQRLLIKFLAVHGHLLSAETVQKLEALIGKTASSTPKDALGQFNRDVDAVGDRMSDGRWCC